MSISEASKAIPTRPKPERQLSAFAQLIGAFTSTSLSVSAPSKREDHLHDGGDESDDESPERSQGEEVDEEGLMWEAQVSDCV